MAKARMAYVLVVDDTPENLLWTETLLQKPGRTVVPAVSGEEALMALKAQQYAVVVLDVHMPGLDGFAVAERIRADPETSHLPIIFVTGVKTAEGHALEGYERGAVDYLVKPVNPHALRSKVEVFCNLQAQRELIAEYVEEIEAKNEALGRQLAEIKKLQGLIPICCCCKKIKNEDGYWQQVEVYIENHSDAQFTHGYCVECVDQLIAKLPAEPAAD